MEYLPDVILSAIFSLLTPDGLVAVAHASRRLARIADDEFLWQSAIFSTFGIPRRLYPDSDPKTFYVSVLCGRVSWLGAWMMRFGQGFWGVDADAFGGMLRVVLREGEMFGLETLAPPFGTRILESVVETPVFKVNVRGEIECLRPLRKREEEDRAEIGGHGIKVQERPVSKKEKEEEMINKADRVVDEAENDDVHVVLYCECLRPQSHRRRDDYRNVNEEDGTTSRRDLRYFRGYEKGFQFHFWAKSFRWPLVHDSTFVGPLRSGLYKGTYGRYGVELVQVRVDPASATAIGVKVTGDPNVPAGKLSFNANLAEAVYLTLEDQSFLPSLQRVKPMTYPAPLTQPFVLPRYLELDAPNFQFPSICAGRFLARVQVAKMKFTFSRFLPAHLVVFDDDNFCVVVFRLNKLMLFHRIGNL